MRPKFAPLFALTSALVVVLTLSGCDAYKSISSALKKSRTSSAENQVNKIGVNAWLWRATLDTLSFMPLSQADPQGGVIITDWYISPKDPSERIQLSVVILDQDLRADALKVAISRQKQHNGAWVDAPVSAVTVQKMQDIILGKARDLKRAAIVTG